MCSSHDSAPHSSPLQLEAAALKKEPAVRSSTSPTWSLRIGHRDRAKYQFSVLKLRKIQNFFRASADSRSLQYNIRTDLADPTRPRKQVVGTNGRSGASLACG